MTWLDHFGRFLFFTGKGGVGKTSLACATAVRLADAGRKVLLVSTDPASNLTQVFGAEIGSSAPRPIDDVPNLHALNIDPEAAAEVYRARIIDPVRGSMPANVVRDMEEQLSGACTTEIASFDEFTSLLTDDEQTSDYDCIIFDTAPTGHTLRLMKLPAAWSSFIDTNESGASCLGPLAGLAKQRERYAAAVDVLADGAQTGLILVTRPEQAALREADRTHRELEALGVRNQRLIINGAMPKSASDDPLAQAMRKRGADAVDAMPKGLRALPADTVELQGHNLIGVKALRALLDPSQSDEHAAADDAAPTKSIRTDVPSLSALIDEIAAPGHGLVMVMGKGGVGKTTIAAAVAVELAARGEQVHLTTTDPAAHVEQLIDHAPVNLHVDRIDPEAETTRYREHVLATKGKDLDAQGRRVLEEDLRSPCTEEVAVFHAFSRVIREASSTFVVVDTAPTGHTLLLLDATGSYHREVMRSIGDAPGKITTPMMRLQDPNQTKMLLVTLPETTPVLEAAQLQDDLRRAGIEPWAWVVNASLAAAGPTDPLLVRRAAAELDLIESVRTVHAERVAVVPWQPREPVGIEDLRTLTRPTGREASAAVV